MTAPEPRWRTIRADVIAAFGAMLAATLMTWPLLRDARDHVLLGMYHWDAYTNAMILAGHVDAVLGRAPLTLYDNYFFAPLPNTLVYNENLFGLSLIFAPFYLLSSNPLWAYNLTLWSTTALSVFFTYLLLRRLTGSGLTGFLLGVAFAFSPYVMFEIGRIQLVATPWIPACVLFLHKAIEERRLRDVVALWVCYLLQIGTCLYYAMFLIPLLGLLGGVLLYRHRPPLTLYLQLLGVGAVAGGVALAMVYPYFTARTTFDLERTLAFASQYDGRFSFFANVHDTNRTLTRLYHRSDQGAREQIAFPGFTVLGMLLLAVGVPLFQTLRSQGARAVGSVAWRWGATAVLMLGATLLTHGMLAGALVLGLSLWLHAQTLTGSVFAGRRGLYVALLILAVLLFLGLAPLSYRGAPVHGLYYYFHSYFPGFNGIRKVSRQAVMTTFFGVVLASFGCAWLFSKLRRPAAKGVLFSALLAAICFELRCFPHPMFGVWAGANVPEAYRFMAGLPAHDLVAAVPQNTGVRLFRGDHGLALHNYLMLYHKHRSLNGQSSWYPPVTDLVSRALQDLPDPGARRVLQGLKLRHLLIHADELKLNRRSLPDELLAQPEYFRRVFQQGSDSVFTLAETEDASLELSDTPALPSAAQALPQSELTSTGFETRDLALATDGKLGTAWAGRRRQARGQWFQLTLPKARNLVALELHNPRNLTHLPMAFDVRVVNGDGRWEIVAQQPTLRVPRDLVFSPKTYVFRVVFKAPISADRIRITLLEPVPGAPFTIHEAKLFALPEAPAHP